MASAGLSTPLLAVHWYRIILSGVPGLLTFKTVMDDPWGKTLESPTCVHVIIGEGFPEALQDNVTLLPSTIVRMASETFTNGATEENRTKHTMLEKTLGKDFRVEFFHPVISKAVKEIAHAKHSAVHSEQNAWICYFLSYCMWCRCMTQKVTKLVQTMKMLTSLKIWVTYQRWWCWQ